MKVLGKHNRFILTARGLVIHLLVLGIVGFGMVGMAEGQWNNMGSIIGPTSSYGGAMSFTDGILYAGINQVYKSLDSGVTWSGPLLPVTSLIGDICFFDKQIGAVAVYSKGIYYTVNGGSSWTPILSGNHFLGVTFGRTGSEIFVADRDNLRGTASTTHNAGMNWIQQQVEGSGGGAYQVIYSDRTQKAYMLSRSVLTPRSSHIEISTDFGATWIRQAGNVDLDTYSFSLDSCDENLVYLLNEQFNEAGNNFSEVYVSKNNGTTYTATIQKPVNFFSSASSASAHAFYAGSASGQGVFRTTDQGANWIAIGGPNQHEDTRLVCAINDNIVLAADNQGRIWRTLNSGGFPITIEPIYSIQGVLAPKQCYTDSVKIIIGNRPCNTTQILDAVLGGVNVDNFSLRHDNFPRLITGSEKDTIIVKVDPHQTQGPFDANVTVKIFNPSTGLYYDTTFTFHVQTFPQPPNLSSNTPLLNFDTVSICDALRDSLVRLTNHGCDTLRILSGPGGLAPGFSADLLKFPIILPPDSSVNVYFHFDPLTATVYETDAQFTAEHKGLTQNVSILLRGKGVAGASNKPTLDSVLAFHSVSICDGYKDTVITLTNVGCDSLTILSGPGILGDEFTIDSLYLPITLPPDSSVTIIVHFHPKATGSYTSKARFLIEQTGIKQNIDLGLSGLGTTQNAGPTLLTSQINFGLVAPCDSLRDSVVTFTNRGCDTLWILSGPGTLSPGFSADGLTFPIILPPDSSVSIRFYFHAGKNGTYSTTAVYKTQRTGNPVVDEKIALQGRNNGSIFGPIVTQSSYVFDPLSTCDPRRDTIVTFTNQGCDTLFILSGAGNLGSGFTTDDLTYPIIILPGESFDIHFYFQPSAEQTYLGYPHFQIRRAGIETGLDLYLQGAGIGGESVFSVFTPILQFKPLSICSSDSLEIVCASSGCDSIQVTEIGLLGDSDFSASGDATTILGDHDSIRVIIHIDPKQSGKRTAIYRLQLKNRAGIIRDTIITISADVINGTKLLSASAQNINFGTKTVCTSPDTSITLYNHGCDTLWITDYTVNGNGFDITNKQVPFFILPNDSSIVAIHTHTDTLGGEQINFDTLRVLSNTDGFFAPIPLERGYEFRKSYSLRLEMGSEFTTAGDTISLRIIADSLPVGVTTVSTTLQTGNDDFLSYLRTNSINTVSIQNKTITITGSPIQTLNGVLAELIYVTYLSIDSSWAVSLSKSQFNPSDVSYENCIASVESDSTGINYVFICGEHILVDYLRSGVPLSIVAIRPNPTSSQAAMEVSARVAASYQLDLTDELGRLIEHRVVDVPVGHSNIPIALKNIPSGIYVVSIGGLHCKLIIDR